MNGDRNRVTGSEHNLACIAVFTPKESPRPLLDHEHFCSIVAVQRIGAARWLAGTTDVEAVRLADVDVLMRMFGHSRPDDGEVFLAVAARAAGIDERVGAGPQFVVAN